MDNNVMSIVHPNQAAPDRKLNIRIENKSVILACRKTISLRWHRRRKLKGESTA